MKADSRRETTKQYPHPSPDPEDEEMTGITNPSDRPEDEQVDEDELRRRRRIKRQDSTEKDSVQEASEESFPASDPPAWTPHA